MKQRVFDPLRVDVAAFAADGSAAEGEWAVSSLERLATACVQPADGVPVDAVKWQASGQVRKLRGGGSEPWLQLTAQARVWLECQRCLQPLVESLDVARDYRFVGTEEEAEAQDVDSEEDVLVLSRTLDLRALVEDELILALPLVPRHAVCPEPLPVPEDAEAEVPEVADKPHPFAGLAALKKAPPKH